jgi:hypothetical protein
MVGLIITFIITLLISILWTIGINNAIEQYPDYKGEDFLNTYETKYDFYKLSENKSGKKARQKKQIPQIKAKAK